MLIKQAFRDVEKPQENAELWTEEAVVNHPKWKSVRVLARNALAALGWDE